MFRVIQKAQTLLTPLVLLGLFVLVVAPAAPVSAAAKTGMCLLTHTANQTVNGVNTCDTFIPSGKDASGKNLDPKACYQVYEDQTGSVFVQKKLDCGNIALTKSPKYVCNDGSKAPNNDPSKCGNGGGGSSGGGSGNSGGKADWSGGGDCSTGLAKCDLFTHYITPFINLLAALVGIIVVVSIVIGGIQYASSGGDPQQAAAAKNRIRNAILALITFIFLYALLRFLLPGGFSNA